MGSTGLKYKNVENLNHIQYEALYGNMQKKQILGNSTDRQHYGKTSQNQLPVQSYYKQTNRSNNNNSSGYKNNGNQMN